MEAICGRAPLRIGLAGGGTDLNEVFEKYGGCCINATIDKYVHAMVELSDKTTINGEEPDKFTNEILNKLEMKNVKISTWCEVPWSRGLGSSCTYSVLLAKLLSQLVNKELSDDEIAKLVYGVENALGKCGWQDQFAVLKGGFNWLDFEEKGYINVYPLRLKDKTIKELEEHLCLVYSGIDHNSGMIHKESPIMTKDIAEKLKMLAVDTRRCLLDNNIKSIPDILNKGWELKKNSKTTSPQIESLLINAMANGASGAKVSGAGKGGYILFYVEPEEMYMFRNNLKLLGYEILDFKFTNNGVETWEKI